MPSVKLRDYLVGIVGLSVAEGYAVLQFAPQLKPSGPISRLGLRLFLVNFVLVVLYQLLIYPFFVSPLRRLPGPPGGNLILGHGLSQFERPPGDRLKRWMNDIPNSGLIYFRGMFNMPTLLPTSHETLKAVLSDHTYDYEKPQRFITLLRRILGDGLILVEGNVHKFQRKHLMPSFQVKHIRDLYPVFWRKSCEMAETIADPKEAASGIEMEFGMWCMRSTLDIIGIAGLGRDFNSLQNPDDEIVERYHTILEPDREKLLWFALQIIFPQWIINALPWHINEKVSEIQQYLYNFALGVVKDRRAKFQKDKNSELNDIISLLVRSNDFTDDELAHQTLTMMAAGHETTSSTLSWCAFLLSKHSDIQKKVRDEVRANLPAPGSGETISAAEIDALPWLNAVCNETTRLYPTVPVTIREVVKETELGGLTVPVGTNVLLAPWAINRAKHFWGEQAEQFKPERWINADGTPNNTGGSTSNYALMTFLHGPRSCIGQGFARSELKCLLAAFVGRYEFGLSRGEDSYFPAGLVTTKPNSGMWLNLKTVPGW